MAMTKLQRQFSKSIVAKALYKEWAKAAGEDYRDEAIKEAYFTTCQMFPDDMITGILTEVLYCDDATEKVKTAAIALLSGDGCCIQDDYAV